MLSEARSTSRAAGGGPTKPSIAWTPWRRSAARHGSISAIGTSPPIPCGHGVSPRDRPSRRSPARFPGTRGCRRCADACTRPRGVSERRRGGLRAVALDPRHRYARQRSAGGARCPRRARGRRGDAHDGPCERGCSGARGRRGRRTMTARERRRRVLAIPMKDLVNAKQRLVSALGAEERRALAAAMLEDVLAAVADAMLDAVWIVTRDAEAAAIARRFGATVVTEPENRGHTAAVADAQRRAHGEGVAVFATIPGDVPCVTAAEVDALVSAVPATPGAALAPSRSGLGTNGVAPAPPDALALRFGQPSFDRPPAGKAS